MPQQQHSIEEKIGLPWQVLNALGPVVIGATFFPRASAVQMILEALERGERGRGKEGMFSGQARLLDTPKGRFAVKWLDYRARGRDVEASPKTVAYWTRYRDLVERSTSADPVRGLLLPTQAVPDSWVAPVRGGSPRKGWWIIQPALEEGYKEVVEEAPAMLRDVERIVRKKGFEIIDVDPHHTFGGGYMGHNVGRYQGRPVLYDLGTILHSGTPGRRPRTTRSFEDYASSPESTPVPSSKTEGGGPRSARLDIRKRMKSKGISIEVGQTSDAGNIFRRRGGGWVPTSSSGEPALSIPNKGAVTGLLEDVRDIGGGRLRGRVPSQLGWRDLNIFPGAGPGDLAEWSPKGGWQVVEQARHRVPTSAERPPAGEQLRFRMREGVGAEGGRSLVPSLQPAYAGLGTLRKFFPRKALKAGGAAGLGFAMLAALLGEKGE